MRNKTLKIFFNFLSERFRDFHELLHIYQLNILSLIHFFLPWIFSASLLMVVVILVIFLFFVTSFLSFFMVSIFIWKRHFSRKKSYIFIDTAFINKVATYYAFYIFLSFKFLAQSYSIHLSIFSAFYLYLKIAYFEKSYIFIDTAFIYKVVTYYAFNFQGI